jgi:C1A family cysteine protease
MHDGPQDPTLRLEAQPARPGHEVLLVGYLKNEPHYGLVRNSWGSEQTNGTAWGLDGDGYFLMPWTYILSASLAGDWTTIVRSTAS